MSDSGSDQVHPGDTELTRMPRGASAAAWFFVICSSAAFDAG